MPSKQQFLIECPNLVSWLLRVTSSSASASASGSVSPPVRGGVEQQATADESDSPQFYPVEDPLGVSVLLGGLAAEVPLGV